jgi:hypothetical protein
MSDSKEHDQSKDRQHNSESRQQAFEPGVVAVSTNEFAALEARVVRAVEVVRRERQARTAAEERATQAESQIRDQSTHLSQLEQELSALRAERDQVRERVERLLGQLDALEL